MTGKNSYLEKSKSIVPKTQKYITITKAKNIVSFPKKGKLLRFYRKT